MSIRTEISVLVCCLVFSRLSTSGSPSNGVGSEVIALMGIKSFLVDPNGVLENWDEASPDPCTWSMVTCSADGQVIGLGAPSQGLSGVLAPSIGNLTNIQTVLLQDNNISGNIPSEIGKLSKLQNLDLSNNNFCGQIPTTFSHLKNLEFLRLTGNNLSGEIPASLANLTDLHLIDLSFNNLSGKIPILPAQVFNIEGNPYLYTKGTYMVDKGSLPDSSKAKLNKSGIFYVIPILMVPCYYSYFWDSSFFI
ncbi:hypothetical protein ES288_A03G133500v1 [Gossypium darwinii]|nr:hypothetical protein ES288_A03G133500v1 [Gossypium darwinii]